MQEDVLGTRRSAIPALVFVTCMRCGKAIARQDAKIVGSSTLTDSTTEFEYLCRDCQSAMESGDDVAAEEA